MIAPTEAERLALAIERTEAALAQQRPFAKRRPHRTGCLMMWMV
jgi:hypothetical protein